MIKHYKKNLLSFSYPANWVLSDTNGEQLPKEFALESPDGDIWMLNVFSDRVSADDLLTETLSSLQSNYQDFEHSDTESTFQPKPVHAKEANFFCLDFLVAAKIFVLHCVPFHYLVIHQSQDQRYDDVSPVFDAITTSLLMESDSNES